MLMWWYGILVYIIASECVSLLDTWQGTIAFLAAFTGSMLLFGILLCVLVARQRQNKERDMRR